MEPTHQIGDALIGFSRHTRAGKLAMADAAFALSALMG
jgi:hypothetical protein